MAEIKAKNGQIVTEKMIDSWCEALDRDEWPVGEKNIGKVVIGRPPLSSEGPTVLSVKIPVAMKKAIEDHAKNDGLSTSDYVRTVLARDLMSA